MEILVEHIIFQCHVAIFVWCICTDALEQPPSELLVVGIVGSLRWHLFIGKICSANHVVKTWKLPLDQKMEMDVRDSSTSPW